MDKQTCESYYIVSMKLTTKMHMHRYYYTLVLGVLQLYSRSKLRTSKVWISLLNNF